MAAFDATRLRGRLLRSGALLVQMLTELDPDEARRRPAPDQWSPLEIAAHLVDEERDDFRARLRSTLEDPSRAWEPIDPEGWVQSRHYAQWDLAATIEEFEDERAASIGWLVVIGDARWDAAYQHPKLGPLRAGDLLAAWVAHDLLHLAQLARTRARLLEGSLAPYSARYAMP